MELKKNLNMILILHSLLEPSITSKVYSQKTLEYMNDVLEIGMFDLDALAIKASEYLNLKK